MDDWQKLVTLMLLMATLIPVDDGISSRSSLDVHPD
jgi:hypothetical protein